MAASTKLRELVAHDPSRVLGADELQQLDAMFGELDEDGDGEITRVELRRSLGDRQAAPFVTESRVDAFLRDMDLDGDGSLTFEELTSVTALRQLESVLAQIQNERAILAPNSDVDEEALSEALLDPLLEVLGLHEAARRVTALAGIERGADGRVYPESLALAYFAAKQRPA